LVIVYDESLHKIYHSLLTMYTFHDTLYNDNDSFGACL